MLRLILMLPFLILLVVFVLYNQTPGTMELPSLAWQSSVGVVALIASAVFFLLGALIVWFSELAQRRRARRAEQQVRALETQLAELRGQLTQTVAQQTALHPPTGIGATPLAY
jgi:putative membrane protein